MGENTDITLVGVISPDIIAVIRKSAEEAIKEIDEGKETKQTKTKAKKGA